MRRCAVFVNLLRSKFSTVFSVDLRSDYDPELTRLHEEHLADDGLRGVYDPEIHYPKLLVLTKLREWEEEGRDGEAAREFQYKRR